jgi:predicted phosphodiesterase
VKQQLVVCGHTHRLYRTIDGHRVVNAGSVGIPLTGTEAEWLLVGEAVEPRRTAYDRSAAARHIMATDYPRKDEFIQTVLS